MNDSWKWPTDKGGNLNTFPDSLYSNLGKYILQNPTRNQRQMFFMPNITPLCCILIILITVCYLTVSEILSYDKCYVDSYLETKNFNYEDSEFSEFNKGIFLSVTIKRSGKVCFDAKEVENLEILADKIIDYCKDYGMQGDKIFIPKIHFKAAGEIPFGTMVDVLKVFQKLGIQNVGFITEGYSQPLIEFFSGYPNHKIRAKRHQDSYSRIPLKY
jgi:biopolymer transport protein ExbD